MHKYTVYTWTALPFDRLRKGRRWFYTNEKLPDFGKYIFVLRSNDGTLDFIKYPSTKSDFFYEKEFKEKYQAWAYATVHLKDLESLTITIQDGGDKVIGEPEIINCSDLFHSSESKQSDPGDTIDGSSG